LTDSSHGSNLNREQCSEPTPNLRLKPKRCDYCNREFIPKNNAQRFCDNICYNKSTDVQHYESYPCVRCGSKEIRACGCVCFKCRRLREVLDSRTAWVNLLKNGLVLVYFHESGSWVLQPKSLADRNKALGKDTFEPSQISEKWLPHSLMQKIEAFKSELEESDSE
jgi:hypothetical protein